MVKFSIVVDESFDKASGTVALGAVTLESHWISAANNVIGQVKRRHGLSKQTVLHFNNYAPSVRSASNLAGWLDGRIDSLYLDLIVGLRAIPAKCGMHTMLVALPYVVPHFDGQPGDELNVKHLTLVIMTALTNELNRKWGKDYQVIWDGDQTGVQWFGHRRVPMDEHTLFYADNTPVKFVPGSDDTDPLLQVADFNAYIGAKVAGNHPAPNLPRYRRLYRKIDPWHNKTELTFNPDNGENVSVRPDR